MTSNDLPRFISVRLDEILCGTVELSVPLRDDVIQVGVRDAPDIATIRVWKGHRAVTVTRVDLRPIQVAILRGVGEALTTSTVFHEPVSSLRLECRRDYRGHIRWHAAGEDANITTPMNIKQFADIIGVFALAKQTRAASVAI